MYQGVIDMRSDTVTRPTEEMKRAMYQAEVGDDVFGDDPTAIKLEEYAAGLMGKEAALFMASGTMGNEVALFTHCTKGDEVIVAEQDHIVQHEAGGAAHIAGVQLRTINAGLGYASWADIEPRIRAYKDIHAPRTGLISVENPICTGAVIPMPLLEGISHGARTYDIPVHMDGARVFAAASYLAIPASDIARQTDSIMFCLSKNLCAPVGSMLAGTKEFIARARGRRKILGGGMRQVGILAAAGLVALQKMTLRLHEDRQKMISLHHELAATNLFELTPETVQTNMFFARFTDPGYRGKEKAFASAYRKRAVWIGVRHDGWVRFVAHNDISFEDIQKVVGLLGTALDEAKSSKG